MFNVLYKQGRCCLFYYETAVAVHCLCSFAIDHNNNNKPDNCPSSTGGRLVNWALNRQYNQPKTHSKSTLHALLSLVNIIETNLYNFFVCLYSFTSTKNASLNICNLRKTDSNSLDIDLTKNLLSPKIISGACYIREKYLNVHNYYSILRKTACYSLVCKTDCPYISVKAKVGDCRQHTHLVCRLAGLLHGSKPLGAWFKSVGHVIHRGSAGLGSHNQNKHCKYNSVLNHPG